MDLRKLIATLVLGVLPFVTMGQSKVKIKKANERFENKAYANAIATYEELVDNGYSSEEAFKSLGDAYYYNADYPSAVEWYGRLLEMEGVEQGADYVYRYAQSLKSLERYSESHQWMQKLGTMHPEDIRVNKFKTVANYLEKIREQSGRYTIKNVSFNSAASDFAPSFYGERIVFSSARDTGKVVKKIHSWNNNPFLNLFSVEKLDGDGYSGAVNLSTSLNKKTHESSAVFTKDGNTVYFTRNNSEGNRFVRDNQGVSRLKLYRATLIDSEWKDIEELPFNSDDHSVAHPALSVDEKQLYFASDMPGTHGASDIFKVDIKEDGSFGTPKNLGSEINTESRETFPFISGDSVLYFASDGHPGLGGLDVFATKIEDMDNLYVVNLGQSVNSVQDDFSYIIRNKNGFFTSNREGGQGSDDIYSFTEDKPLNLSCTIKVEGIVLDQESKKPLEKTELKLLGSNGKVITNTVSSRDGTFVIDGNCKRGNYTLVAEKDDFKSTEMSFDVLSSNDVSRIRLTLERSIKKAEAGTELLQFLELNPIYFELDDSAIPPDAQSTLDKVITYLKRFPNLKVEIQSHTDAKGGKAYNQRLSDARANSSMEYLIANGINSNRLTAKGFGESQLINGCLDWQTCSDKENELNRRSEFVVIE